MSKYVFNNSKDDVFKQAVHKFPTRGVISHGVGDIISIDLVDMSNNRKSGFAYILNMVDVFSRKSWSIPLKRKDKENLTLGIDSLIEKMKHKPHKLWSDQEPALYAIKKHLLDKYGITIYSTFGYNSKSCICERYNLTLKNAMSRARENGNWPTFCVKFCDVYNKTVHSSLGMSPDESYFKYNEDTERINQANYNEPRINSQSILTVGSKVRLSIKHATFTKKSTVQKWTDEVFEIVEVRPTNPIVYVIKDAKNEIISRNVYRQELHLVK